MSYQGGSLIIECPSCGDRDSKKNITVDTTPYCSSLDRKEFFNRIAGRDLYYRKRTRQCSECNHTFDTVEMASLYLDGLMKEIDRLEGEVEKSNKKLVSAKNFLEKLIQLK